MAFAESEAMNTKEPASNVLVSNAKIHDANYCVQYVHSR